MGARAEGRKYSRAVRATTMMRSKLIRFAQNTLLACIAFTVAGGLSAYAGNDRELLAPTGSLRLGVYPGRPTSMGADPATGQTHGLSYDLGQELAKRLQVPVVYIAFPRVADVVTAIKNGDV